MITSTDNGQVKHLVQLNKKAKLRRETNTFIVEGLKMFLEAPKERLEGVYVSETFLRDAEHEKYLNGITYEVLSDKVFAHVSDTQTPQGILCVVRQKSYTYEELIPKEKPAHLLVVESIQDPGNLGTMFRAGEGAGITGIIMNRTTVDLYNPKTIRSTMGSVYRVPYICVDSLEASVAELKKRGIRICAAHLLGSCDYDQVDYTKGCAFLIGNEGNGLSDSISACADTRIKIPMEGQVESLNAAVAASVLMYEVKRQRKEKR